MRFCCYRKNTAFGWCSYFKMFMGPRNWFQGMNSASLCSLAGRFLAPMDFLKIPALYAFFERVNLCSFYIQEENKNSDTNDDIFYSYLLKGGSLRIFDNDIDNRVWKIKYFLIFCKLSHTFHASKHAFGKPMYVIVADFFYKGSRGGRSAYEFS